MNIAHRRYLTLFLLAFLIPLGCSSLLRDDETEEIRIPAWLSGDEEEKKKEEPADVKTQVVVEFGRLTSEVRGQKLYRDACATCHGRRGDGRGPSAAALDPEPADFTIGAYMTDLEYFQVISNGVGKTMMPAWKNLLSQEERWDVVSYLKSFSSDEES